MSVDILGTSWDQCRSMVQYSFMSTETRRLIRRDSPGRPPDSHTAHELWWCGGKWFIRTYQLWQLPGQGGWPWMRSGVVHCLCQSPTTLLVPPCSPAPISPKTAISPKAGQKTPFSSSPPPPPPFSPPPVVVITWVSSASSEPVDNRLPTQESKQIRQESASISKRPKSNQAPVKNDDCHGGS